MRNQFGEVSVNEIEASSGTQVLIGTKTFTREYLEDEIFALEDIPANARVFRVTIDVDSNIWGAGSASLDVDLGTNESPVALSPKNGNGTQLNSFTYVIQAQILNNKELVPSSVNMKFKADTVAVNGLSFNYLIEYVQE